jgi:hypothetical protein
LLGPGNIDIGELLVRMQFAIYISAPEFNMAPNSETGTLDEESSVIIEDEEDTEVIIENEETKVTAEEEETDNSADDQEEAEVSNDKEDGNSERNVSDVTPPEIAEHIKWNDLIEQEEEKQEVLFIFSIHLQLRVSLKISGSVILLLIPSTAFLQTSLYNVVAVCLLVHPLPLHDSVLSFPIFPVCWKQKCKKYY